MKKTAFGVLFFTAYLIFAGQAVTKSKLTGAFIYGYLFDKGDPEMSEMQMSVPDGSFLFEIEPNETFKMYAHTYAAYKMSQIKYDGKTPPGSDKLANEINFSFRPAVKANLEYSTFVKAGLPVEIRTYSLQSEDNNGRYLDKYLPLTLDFGFDNRETEMHNLTPWERFENGLACYGTFEQAIMKSEHNESFDHLPAYIGLETAYAYKSESFMLKVYLDYQYQLNDNYTGSSAERPGMNTWLTAGGMYAQDFSTVFNLEADLHFSVNELEKIDELDKGNYNYIAMSLKANYYPKEEIRLWIGAGADADLTTTNSEPVYNASAGIEATLNMLKKY